MGVVIDRGFERKFLEVVQDFRDLTPEEQKRFNWLGDQVMVIRCGDFEQGISKKQWREIK